MSQISWVVLDDRYHIRLSFHSHELEAIQHAVYTLLMDLDPDDYPEFSLAYREKRWLDCWTIARKLGFDKDYEIIEIGTMQSGEEIVRRRKLH